MTPGSPSDLPLKLQQTILDQEMREAELELARPALGLVLSGLLAGFGVGFSVLIAAVLMTQFGPHVSEPARELLIANAYTIGFMLVILARTDLFTEYTTIAILPVLDGRASVGRLARLWGLVYVGNIAGTAAIAAVVVVAGQGLQVADPRSFATMAERLVGHSPAVILVSSCLAGWLMGLLSWLVISARETISQIFVIWLVTFIIGYAHLHHSITGSVEALVGVFTAAHLRAEEYAHFLGWTTLGNIVGGVVFAVLIRYSTLLSASRDKPDTERSGSARRTNRSRAREGGSNDSGF